MSNEEEHLEINLQWKNKKPKGKKKTERVKKTLVDKNALNARKSPKITSLKKSVTGLPKDLNKIRKKIREVFDDEEDEEEELQKKAGLEMLEMQQSSLIDALNQKEKENLVTHQSIENVNKVNNAVLAIGLNNLSKKVVENAAINTAIGTNIKEEVLKNSLQEKVKTKVDKLSEKETIQALRGIEELGQDVKNIDTKELVEVGKKSKKEIAKIILEKTGRRKPIKAKKELKEKKRLNDLSNTNQR